MDRFTVETPGGQATVRQVSAGRWDVEFSAAPGRVIGSVEKMSAGLFDAVVPGRAPTRGNDLEHAVRIVGYQAANPGI